MRNIFILLPSPSPSGPIKGAYAIANQITSEHKVYLVFLKKGDGVSSFLSEEVKVVNLASYKNWIVKRNKLQNLINNFEDPIILSMCFSADFINLFLNKKIYKISSIRGNLFKNYLYDYGLIGILPAFFQLYIQRFFDQSFSMNNSMYKMIKKISGKRSIVIPNFIEENEIKKYFKFKKNLYEPIRFIFIGQLNKRKNPLLLIKSFKKILPINASLSIVGNGPLYIDCQKLIKKLNLSNLVTLHSFLPKPFEILSDSDVFVLPSHSEGTSRAMLEALFLGVKCVLRDVDSNREVINDENGILFKHDNELPLAMLKAAFISRIESRRKNLLPKNNREEYVKNLFLLALRK